jgi:NAD(P)-dependent dehydrogenase (short-subunit alcohol dehydrogenase family)
VLTDEEWQKALNVNLMAAVRFDRGLLPGMLERRSGVILHIASIQHRLPLYDSTLAYAAANYHLQQGPCERSRTEGRTGECDLAGLH